MDKMVGYQMMYKGSIFNLFCATPKCYFVSRNQLTFVAIVKAKDGGIDLMRDSEVINPDGFKDRKYITLMHSATPFSKIEGNFELLDKIIQTANDY